MYRLKTIRECSCNRYYTRSLTTFKVSDNLTYLICLRCGGKFGEWIRKVYPPDKDFSKFDQEMMV